MENELKKQIEMFSKYNTEQAKGYVMGLKVALDEKEFN